MNDDIAGRLLATEARLEILEVAFVNLVSLMDRKMAEALETAFREIGEEHVMVSDEKGQRVQLQNLAAVRLGKNIEAAVARRYGPET